MSILLIILYNHLFFLDTVILKPRGSGLGYGFVGSISLNQFISWASENPSD